MHCTALEEHPCTRFHYHSSSRRNLPVGKKIHKNVSKCSVERNHRMTEQPSLSIMTFAHVAINGTRHHLHAHSEADFEDFRKSQTYLPVLIEFEFKPNHHHECHVLPEKRKTKGKVKT